MIKFRRIEISNFVCFSQLILEPSIDPAKPLTVIKAENGSGKTTFLRAIRWAIYGERGLPGETEEFSLHPAWWLPEQGPIETQVRIEFETDGSTRHSEGTQSTTRFRITRSVTTISKPQNSAIGPDFLRINERTELHSTAPGEDWSIHAAAPELVLEQLLPWGLRDFFVMDADEVADFVGGSENKHLQREEVIEKTSAAIQNLLGLTVFENARKRVQSRVEEFGFQATKAIGDANLNAMQDQLDLFRASRQKQIESIACLKLNVRKFENRVQLQRNALEVLLRDVGAGNVLREHLVGIQQAGEELKLERAGAVNQLARQLESPSLLASLADVAIRDANSALSPQAKQVSVHPEQLAFLRQLLHDGTCVCGQNLSSESIYRSAIQEIVADSSLLDGHAEHIMRLHQATQALIHRADNNKVQQRIEMLSVLESIDKRAIELDLEKRQIEWKLDAIDEEEIQITRDQIAYTESQLADYRRRLVWEERSLEPLTEKIDSLEKRIHRFKRNRRVAADFQQAEDIGKLIAKILAQAYDSIRTNQVRELSKRMHRLFLQMTSNVSDDELNQLNTGKASFRMIAEVGVRQVGDDGNQFEIYALNGRGRSMPPIEINGASRRILALSFVLALCAESKTRAPLIADSLLNFLSGNVRRNTLRITAEHSSQPILLLTNSDLESERDSDTATAYAGATYTLTGQWDAVDANLGGDVVNLSDERQISLLCDCGPRQYCGICERVGQSSHPKWTRQLTRSGPN